MWYNFGPVEGDHMKSAVCLAALLAAIALPVHAEDRCTLPQVAAFTLKPLPTGGYTIPLVIGGVERDFELGLTDPFSAISGEFADAQGLKTGNLPDGIQPNLHGE